MARIMTPEDKRHMYDHVLGTLMDRIEVGGHHSIAEQTLILFNEKSRGYGGSAINFGTKGELIEISRKFWRLFGILEEGQTDSSGEGVEELCKDMIGHLWMMIFHYRQLDVVPPLAPGERFMFRPMGEGKRVYEGGSWGPTEREQAGGTQTAAMCTCGETSPCRIHGSKVHSDGCTCDSHGIGKPRFDHECPVHGRA